ncbi:dihydrofolate reductase [Mucilaginibacter sp.]|jgi:dihydrofolate reductase|uniref:dihydrofolate reductase n=1 Tax=Mucilaginibacter sp. TaxID=1882438 RepID=UPI0035680DD8
MIRLIAAIDQKRGIAKGGVQPWNIPTDEKYFLEQTSKWGGEVLMGSKTYQVIGHPLPNRKNYVVTRDAVAVNGAEIVNDLDSFLKGFGRDLWIVGGASIFEQTLPYADELYLTKIEADFGCDQFFPDYDATFMPFGEDPLQTENGFIYKFCVYTKRQQ